VTESPIESQAVVAWIPLFTSTEDIPLTPIDPGTSMIIPGNIGTIAGFLMYLLYRVPKIPMAKEAKKETVSAPKNQLPK
jgi:hypothetical protein